MDLEQIQNRSRAGGSGASAADYAGADDGLDVEVVEEVPVSGDGGLPDGVGRRGSTSARVARERMRRLALEARVTTLEDRLEAKQRQCEQVIERYEAVLDDRADAPSPVGTWTDEG